MLQVSKIALAGTLKKVVAFIPKIKGSTNSGVISFLPDDPHVRLILSFPEASMESKCTLTSIEGPSETIALNGRKFLSIVAASDKEIELDTDEGYAVIKTGSTKWQEPMPNVSANRIKLPDTDPVKFDVYPLLKAMNTVRYAVDSDSVRPALFMIDVSDGRVRACNGFQYHEMSTDITGLTFTVPGNMVENFVAVLRYFDGEVEFYSDDNSYYFKNGDDLISIRKLQLKFPDLDRLLVRPLRSAVPALLQVRKKDMLDALKQVHLVLEDTYPYVELHIHKDTLMFRCTQKAGAFSVAEIKCIWDTKPRIVTFNAKYLAQTLKSLHDGDLEIRFGEDTKNSKSSMVVEGVGTWTMLNQANLSARS